MANHDNISPSSFIIFLRHHMPVMKEGSTVFTGYKITEEKTNQMDILYIYIYYIDILCNNIPIFDKGAKNSFIK